MISGRGRWEGPEDAEPGLAFPFGSSKIWIRRRWRLGPVSVSEALFLRKGQAGWSVCWRRLCFLDEEAQRRLAGMRVLRLLTVLWFWMYLLVSRRDIERQVPLGEARRCWGFLEEEVPEWRRASRLRELGL
jgi:hypothetical protein